MVPLPSTESRKAWGVVEAISWVCHLNFTMVWDGSIMSIQSPLFFECPHSMVPKKWIGRPSGKHILNTMERSTMLMGKFSLFRLGHGFYVANCYCSFTRPGKSPGKTWKNTMVSWGIIIHHPAMPLAISMDLFGGKRCFYHTSLRYTCALKILKLCATFGKNSPVLAIILPKNRSCD